MIIACPACSTRYVVPDSAIGVEGRTVRCAKCKHSWFQDGPELELTGEQAIDTPVPRPSEPPRPAPKPPAADVGPDATPSTPTPRPDRDFADEASGPFPRPERDTGTGIDTEAVASSMPAEDEDSDASGYSYAASALEGPPPVGEATPPPPPMPDRDVEYSQFDYEPPFKPRRNPLKIWTGVAAVFALLTVGTIAAISYYGAPDWLPVSKPTFGVEQPDLVLDFPDDQVDRRTLPDESILVAVSGTITNVGRETRRVPDVLVAFYDETDTRAYRWVIDPEVETLAPGESVTINEANNEIPKRARKARIGWSPS